MNKNLIFPKLMMLFLLFISSFAQAIEIVIDRGVENPIPVAVVPFGWSEAANVAPSDIAGVIRSNLVRSGRFNSMDEGDMRQKPTEAARINFKHWRSLGMDNLVIGNMEVTETGDYLIEFQLFNVHNQQALAKGRIKSQKENLRRTTHQISDIIYEKLLGVKGAFSTRIAYITVKKSPDGKKTHSLKIADADGLNIQTLLNSSEPLMSPNWSPDGRQLAYVSFQDKNSAIYVQNVFTGTREVIQSGPGINSAPAWSPDGKRLAMTLSKDGNPEIYIKHVASGLLQRVTNNPGIDTEPTWSPDGQTLAFTSNRSGRPQIYQIHVEGKKAKRLTFEGKYNTRPIFSPDGKSIAMVNGNNGVFRIAVLDLASGSIELLTDTKLDESPSFAPNGHMIMYATLGFQNTKLAAVSSDGRIQQSLALQEGEVREPAWGPFLK